MQHVYEIKPDDVGKTRLTDDLGLLIILTNVIGKVLHRDVGKRLFRKAHPGGGGHVVSCENDKQLFARLEKSLAYRVALAICKESEIAGKRWDSQMKDSDHTPEQRARNLVVPIGNYGPYIVDGDPYEWGGGEALVTITMEAKGPWGDCEPPLDYYNPHSMDASCRASSHLGDMYIEYYNAAVALVWPV
jgi:hypothetical protein